MQEIEKPELKPEEKKDLAATITLNLAKIFAENNRELIIAGIMADHKKSEFSLRLMISASRNIANAVSRNGSNHDVDHSFFVYEPNNSNYYNYIINSK